MDCLFNTRCNKCGKEIDIFDGISGLNISKDLGYGSQYDGAELRLHICCDCLDKFINDCVVFPIKYYDPAGDTLRDVGQSTSETNSLTSIIHE